ncbi:MAG: hypothetical protein LBM18_04440 [Oscillospiraceae bacterium]|jgi:hypothetical protein|nr:hypothetical protein [Oscillospiraceae bacterium]
MVRDICQYVAFDILEYLREVGRIVPKHPDFCFQQTLDYILPSVFLKMTGCLEHKIDMVTLQLCIDDEGIKQDKLRSATKIPASSGAFQAAIKELIELNANLGLKSKYTDIVQGIWGDISIWERECQRVLDLLDDEIKVAFYFRRGNFNFESRTSLAEAKENLKDKKDYKNVPLKYIIDRAFRFRNIFAHNEDSVYKETKSLSSINNRLAIYDTWSFRFAILTYADSVLKQEFERYINLRNKHSISY